MTANTVRPADGRFLRTILLVLIVATLASGTVAAISTAKSGPGHMSIVTPH
jgi:hypothetical protein